MKIRTVYFKVSDMEKTEKFWTGFLNQKPNKNSDAWLEYQLENIRLGFLLNDFDDAFTGCSAAVMFEYPAKEFPIILHHAKSLGAVTVSDHLENPALRSVILADPNGHEFEIGIEGTHH